MKSILTIRDNISELVNIIHKNQKVEDLEIAIKYLVSLMLKDYPYLKPPKFSIIPTKNKGENYGSSKKTKNYCF